MNNNELKTFKRYVLALRIIIDATTKNEKFHGLYKEYYLCDNRIKEEGNYLNGMKIGLWKYYKYTPYELTEKIHIL